jgi:amidase
VYGALRELEPLSEIRRVSRGRTTDLTDRMRQLLERPTSADPLERGERWADREAQRARFLAVMGDVVLLPVAPSCAWADDGAEPIRIRGTSVERAAITSLLRATSLAGTPVVAVPVATSSAGLPIAIQVVARPDCENVALAVARLLSQSVAAAEVDHP